MLQLCVCVCGVFVRVGALMLCIYDCRHVCAFVRARARVYTCVFVSVCGGGGGRGAAARVPACGSDAVAGGCRNGGEPLLVVRAMKYLVQYGINTPSRLA